MSKARSVLEFMMLIGKLKSTPRTGWVKRNVSNPESISAHMYRMATMAFLVGSNGGLCKDRCIKLALVHDMAECIAGDITPHDGIPASEKHAKEEDAMQHLKSLVDREVGQELYDLWLEYENQTSPESKFVKDLDRFDMILQAFEYETAEKRPKSLQEFFNSCEGKFQNEMVRSWVDELNSLRSTDQAIASNAADLTRDSNVDRCNTSDVERT